MSDDYYYDKPSGPPDDYPGPDRDEEDEAIEVLDTAFTRLIPVSIKDLGPVLASFGVKNSWQLANKILERFEVYTT